MLCRSRVASPAKGDAEEGRGHAGCREQAVGCKPRDDGDGEGAVADEKAPDLRENGSDPRHAAPFAALVGGTLERQAWAKVAAAPA